MTVVKPYWAGIGPNYQYISQTGDENHREHYQVVVSDFIELWKHDDPAAADPFHNLSGHGDENNKPRFDFGPHLTVHDNTDIPEPRFTTRV